jgi:hypothetical protein
MLTVIMLLTGLIGFMISFLLLRANVNEMWQRYPIAVAGAYGGFLGLLRLWVAVERSRFDPQVGEIERDLHDSTEGPEKMWHGSARRSSWLDRLDFPDVFSFDLDEGCLPAILIAALCALVVLLVSAIAAAPGLIAEVFLDAFIISVMYRRLRIAAKEHWLGTAIRKTWWMALLTAALLAISGWCLEQMAPGSRSIGPAIHRLIGR